MKLSKLFGISAVITGAVAITGKPSPISGTSSVITGTPSAISHAATSTSSTSSTLSAVTSVPDIPVTLLDQVHVSFGVGEHCNVTTFDSEHYLVEGKCFSQERPFATLRTRVVPGWVSDITDDSDRCVLVTFTDSNCISGGTIAADLSELGSDDESDDEPVNPNYTLPPKSCFEIFAKPGVQRIPARSVKWVCGDDIDKHWVDPNDTDDEDDLSVSARFVDSAHSKDHVTIAPADNFNCNTAQDRDTDTKLQGHCHPFDQPFFSLRATVERADKGSVIGGSQPCEVLVFSDKKCKRDGASIVDLNNTPSLGVCHNVTLHHGKDVAAIAGHSWKWVCGRQNIDACLKPIVHHSKAHHSAALSTVVDRPTKTVTATTSLSCSITTQAAHYLDVLTSVVTLKPVTHTSTSVFTNTKTYVRTKVITSVATHVSTVLHSVTKPYSTSYMVCDVHATPQA